jgi:hypothetical protein
LAPVGMSKERHQASRKQNVDPIQSHDTAATVCIAIAVVGNSWCS